MPEANVLTPDNLGFQFRVKPGLTAALPWIAVAATFVSVNNVCNTQTVATSFAAGDTSVATAANALWLIPSAACAAGLISAISLRPLHRVIAAVTAFILITLLALLGPQFLLPLLVVPAALIGAHIFFSLKNHSPWKPETFAASLLTIIIAYASYTRQEFFYRLVNTAPDPDLGSYLKFARETVGWATFFREPFYVWLLQIADRLGGDLNPIMVRMTSVVTGLAATAAIFQLCRRHLNLTVALIAATLYADQKYMAYTSGRGLREDTIVCTAILFISMGWSHLRGPVSWKSLTLWGLMGAVCSLLRISSFSFVLVGFGATAAFRFFRDIKSWRQRALWIIPILLTIGLMVPYFVHCKKVYNDPFFVVNYAARYYANEEFGGIRSDFPTREELAIDAYTGPKLTPRDYIFNYHSLDEIVRRTWDGFIKTFFGSVFKIGYSLNQSSQFEGLLYLLHFAGIGLLLFPRRIYLVLAMLLFHGPTFFLASFPSFDPRLLILAMVFGYITIAAVIGLGMEYGYRYLRSSDDQNSKQVTVRKHKPTRQIRKTAR